MANIQTFESLHFKGCNLYFIQNHIIPSLLIEMHQSYGMLYEISGKRHYYEINHTSFSGSQDFTTHHLPDRM